MTTFYIFILYVKIVPYQKISIKCFINGMLQFLIKNRNGEFLGKTIYPVQAVAPIISIVKLDRNKINAACSHM